MTQFGWLLVGLLSPLVLSVTSQAEETAHVSDQSVTLRFVVSVPGETPENATVHLSGNHPLLGNWDGQGIRLTKQDDGNFVTELSFEPNTQLEFKTTRGSWQTVEKLASGAEMDNRHIVADQDKQVVIRVAAWANVDAQQTEPTLTGNIHRHDGFRSEILGNERTLIVYLPPGYDDEPVRLYPVLYMHDGQNIFDAVTSFSGVEWQVDEAAERLILAGTIEPIIIVGIYNNAQRMSEYTPGSADDHGTAYTRFFVEEVRPFIERTYRARSGREGTGIAGSSMGGLISLYMAKAHRDEFDRCGVVSPALGIHNRLFLNQLQQSDAAWMRETRFWVDMGTSESGSSSGNLALQPVRDLVALMESAGLERGKAYQYLEVEGGRHNEWAWSQRIDAILTFLYGR